MHHQPHDKYTVSPAAATHGPPPRRQVTFPVATTTTTNATANAFVATAPVDPASTVAGVAVVGGRYQK